MQGISARIVGAPALSLVPIGSAATDTVAFRIRDVVLAEHQLLDADSLALPVLSAPGAAALALLPGGPGARALWARGRRRMGRPSNA